MSDNQAKRVRYATAWKRIETAKAKGFYLEAVTLCESIMSDRLLSYVHKVNSASKANLQTPFAHLIEEWARPSGSGEPVASPGPDLVDRLHRWRKQRNEVVHGLVKSSIETGTVRQFMAKAKETAEEGTLLARALENWQKREKRRLNRLAQSSAK